MRLDHGLHDGGKPRRVQLLKMPLLDAQRRLRVDALDVDLRHALPERARLPRRHQMRRLPVERHDRDLARTRLHGHEVIGRDLRIRGGQRRIAIPREFPAHDLERLARKALQRIEQPMSPGLKHAHELPVARQKRALVVLHDDSQMQNPASHDTSLLKTRPRSSSPACGGGATLNLNRPHRTAHAKEHRPAHRRMPTAGALSRQVSAALSSVALRRRRSRRRSPPTVSSAGQSGHPPAVLRLGDARSGFRRHDHRFDWASWHAGRYPQSIGMPLQGIAEWESNPRPEGYKPSALPLSYSHGAPNGNRTHDLPVTAGCSTTELRKPIGYCICYNADGCRELKESSRVGGIFR